MKQKKKKKFNALVNASHDEEHFYRKNKNGRRWGTYRKSKVPE